MQEELTNNNAIICQISLVISDVRKTVLLDVLIDQLCRDFLASEQPRMDPNGQGVFV